MERIENKKAAADLALIYAFGGKGKEGRENDET